MNRARAATPVVFQVKLRDIEMFQMLHGCRFRTRVKYGVLLFSQAIFACNLARPGETAIGVEVAKTSDVVAIDITPCQEYKTVLRFWEPYKETGIGLIRCASGYHPQVKVIKQSFF